MLLKIWPPFQAQIGQACQQLPLLRGCTWLPVRWADAKAGLHTVMDSTTLTRPLYAIWLQNSDKQAQIKDLLSVLAYHCFAAKLHTAVW